MYVEKQSTLINIMGQSPIRQIGFTLLELLVALTLGLVIIGELLQILLSSRQAYRLQEAVGQLQESAQVALPLLVAEIRSAGYLGCQSNLTKFADNFHNTLNVASNPLAYRFAYPVQGYEYGGTSSGDDYSPTADPHPGDAHQWTPPLPAPLAGRALAGSDVLVVRRAGLEPLILRGTPYAGNATTLTATSPTLLGGELDKKSFAPGQIVVASDCANTVVFQITRRQDGGGTTTFSHGPTTLTPGNALQDWPAAWWLRATPGASIAPAVTTLFYVGRHFPDNADPEDRFALYSISLDGNGRFASAQERVAGIENMQIRYGVDRDGDLAVNAYLDAATVEGQGLWEQVVSVQIAFLLATTEKGLLPHPLAQRYALNGGDTSPLATHIISIPDGRLRRVVQTVVTLRNRTL